MLDTYVHEASVALGAIDDRVATARSEMKKEKHCGWRRISFTDKAFIYMNTKKRHVGGISSE